MSNGTVPPFDPAEFKKTLDSWLDITRYSSSGHYDAQRKYSRRNLQIGGSAAVLAVLAGSAAVKAFTGKEVPPGFGYAIAGLSLLAGVMAALQTFFKDSDRSERHRSAAAGYAKARRAIQQYLTFPPATRKDAEDAMTAIRKTLDDLSATAPEMPPEILRRVRKGKDDGKGKRNTGEPPPKPAATVAGVKMHYTHLLVLDVETTGLDVASNSIVQIGASLLDRTSLREEAIFETFVKPTTPMTPQAFGVHGIKDEDLAAAPSVAEALTALAAFVPKHALLCGHNVSFDAGFIKAACTQNNIAYPFHYHSLDTWSVAFFVLGARGVALESYKLDALCAHYNIPKAAKHDALGDVRATAEVLRNLSKSIPGDG
jgi:DNA polymerase III epsilon subunit family exonuclease